MHLSPTPTCPRYTANPSGDNEMFSMLSLEENHVALSSCSAGLGRMIDPMMGRMMALSTRVEGADCAKCLAEGRMVRVEIRKPHPRLGNVPNYVWSPANITVKFTCREKGKGDWPI